MSWPSVPGQIFIKIVNNKTDRNVCLGCVRGVCWDVFGVCLGSVRGVSRSWSKVVYSRNWKIQGQNPSGYVWDVFGLSLGCVRGIFGMRSGWNRDSRSWSKVFCPMNWKIFMQFLFFFNLNFYKRWIYWKMFIWACFCSPWGDLGHCGSIPKPWAAFQTKNVSELILRFKIEFLKRNDKINFETSHQHQF